MATVRASVRLYNARDSDFPKTRILYNEERKIYRMPLAGGEFRRLFHNGYMPKHMYFLSEFKPEGDDTLCMDIVGRILRYGDATLNNRGLRPLIATTNPEYHHEIAKIPEYFLTLFVKNQNKYLVRYVDLEYQECECTQQHEIESCEGVKRNADGEVIFHNEPQDEIKKFCEQHTITPQTLVEVYQNTLKNIIRDFNSETYSRSDVLKILQMYDREYKIDTFAYTQPCKYTVEDWFNNKFPE